MNDDEKRDSLFEAVYEEFVGPTDPMSEELLRGETPVRRYSAGILFPQGESFDDEPEVNEDSGSEADGVDEPLTTTNDGSGAAESAARSWSTEDGSEFEEPVSLCNAWRQSAISLTFAARKGDEITLYAEAGSYSKEGDDPKKKTFRRHPVCWGSDPISVEGLVARGRPLKCLILNTKLSVLVVPRREIADGIVVLSAALVNEKKIKGQVENADYRTCYYQARLEANSSVGFEPLPTSGGSALSEEDANNDLIYRNIRNFAIGHGCAADWRSDGDAVTCVTTSIMPQTETRSMKASRDDFDDVCLDLHILCREDAWEQSLGGLTALCDKYGQWISELRDKSLSLDAKFLPAAQANVEKCEKCLGRMRRGLDSLQSDAQLRSAFMMMNEAMLAQHLHYSVVSGKMPEVLEPADGQRSWRPFQIAFILMNICAMSGDLDEDRRILDLIWFPTGGGKTEAYLGLAAFALLLERLRGEENIGSTVIMRYTLRLLTTQQFQRASALICALEQMRLGRKELGSKRFTIGLWLGSSTTPNSWKDAEIKMQKLESGESNEFPVECCPWCGEPMGKRGKDEGRGTGIVRAERLPKTASAKRAVRFSCPNPKCDFHGKGTHDLPFRIVDEDVYNDPPSLLIGTVDKFAMIPYRPESYRIFGINEHGERVSAPKLIIQDELHLISGPLGSMAANFETLVGELCRRDVDGTPFMPKIVASTATISHAKSQCSELFACKPEEVFQFPPSGIDHDDSFFALQETDGPGRRYVGVFAPNLSFASASIALYATLMWRPLHWDIPDDEKDPYWTTVGYYGTIRELGQAATWASADIPERLKNKRRGDKDGKSRYLNRFIELTGRISASEVTSNLKQIEEKYGSRGCVDLCLATNMISVGLDVGRLGLMVVAGQPKSTSEYIQATSRVGRDKAKGIVFVVYGTNRPRDRSHYENFKNFHASLYGAVEPTSLTGFCEQVRERSLPGTFVGLCRSFDPSYEEGYAGVSDDDVKAASDVIKTRVEALDPEELEDTLRYLDEDIVGVWNGHSHDRWCEMAGADGKPRNVVDVPLIFPRGNKDCSDLWGGESFAVPQSLRSVEGQCNVVVLSSYSASSED